MFGIIDDFAKESGDSHLVGRLETIKTMESGDALTALTELMNEMRSKLDENQINQLLYGNPEILQEISVRSILEKEFSKNNTTKFGLKELSQFKIKTLGDISRLVPLSTFENINRFGKKVVGVIRTELHRSGLNFAAELDPLEEHRVFVLYYKSKAVNITDRQAMEVCGLLRIQSLYQLSEITLNHFIDASAAYRRIHKGITDQYKFANTMVDSIMPYMNLLNIEFKPEEKLTDEREA